MDQSDAIKRLQQRLYRERKARQEAERLLEDKSRELYYTNQELRQLAESLEEKVAQRTQELVSARDTALKADRAKTNFLATMSHEIRTPMNGIIGMATLLKGSQLLPDQMRQVDTILNTSLSLLSLINDILDLSRLNADRLELIQEEFDLCQHVSAILETLDGIASQKQLELVSIIHHDVPAILYGDSARLRQILTNLIGNALKFTKQGYTALRIKRSKHAQMLRFEIEDSGCGIPEDRMNDLFKTFSQIRPEDQHNQSGTGLGLAITQKLVNLMHGKIGVYSEVDKGTTFWFELPLLKAEAKVVQALALKPCPEIRCIILTDSPLQGRLLFEQLQQLQLKSIEIAFDLKTVEKIIQQQTYDWLLSIPQNCTDTQWNQCNQLHSLAQRFKNRIKHLAHLTGQSVYCPCPNGLANFKHYSNNYHILHKPVTPLKLSQLFHNESIQANTQPNDNEKSQQQKRLNILVVEDNKVNQLVANGLLARLGHHVTILDNGEKALTELTENRNFDLILMDVQMPVMGGVEATMKIRSTYTDWPIPILALTANVLPEDQEHYIQSGMNACLLKPIQLKELEKAIQRWGSTQSLEVLAQAPAQSAPVLTE